MQGPELYSTTVSSISITPYISGTYNIRTQEWSHLQPGQTIPLSSSNDIWCIPSYYTLTVQYTLSREDYTESPGQYAARGSVVDIFCIQENLPFRLYFAGNRLDMISTFDLDTQNTQQQADQITVLPLSFEQTPATLIDYLAETSFVLTNRHPILILLRIQLFMSLRPCRTPTHGMPGSKRPLHSKLT